MNFFQTILKYARYINPTTIAAVMAVVTAVNALLEIFKDEPVVIDGENK